MKVVMVPIQITLDFDGRGMRGGVGIRAVDLSILRKHPSRREGSCGGIWGSRGQNSISMSFCFLGCRRIVSTEILKVPHAGDFHILWALWVGLLKFLPWPWSHSRTRNSQALVQNGLMLTRLLVPRLELGPVCLDCSQRSQAQPNNSMLHPELWFDGKCYESCV